MLPVDRAMPFWIDLAEGEEIDPLTLAHAQGSGLDVADPDARAIRLRRRLFRRAFRYRRGAGGNRGGPRPQDRTAPRHTNRFMQAARRLARQLRRRRPRTVIRRAA